VRQVAEADADRTALEVVDQVVSGVAPDDQDDRDQRDLVEDIAKSFSDMHVVGSAPSPKHDRLAAICTASRVVGTQPALAPALVNPWAQGTSGRPCSTGRWGRVRSPAV